MMGVIIEKMFFPPNDIVKVMALKKKDLVKKANSWVLNHVLDDKLRHILGANACMVIRKFHNALN